MLGVAPRARLHRGAPIGPDCTVGPRSGPIAPLGFDRAPNCAVGPQSGPDCAVGPRSGPTQSGPVNCTKLASPSFAIDRVAFRMPRVTGVELYYGWLGLHHGMIGARLHRRAPIGPRLRRRAPRLRRRAPQGEIALSLVALLYKAASSATPVRMVPGRFWELFVLFFPQQLKGSTRVPRGPHVGGYHLSLFLFRLRGLSPDRLRGGPGRP